jgi:hypothetical protein
MIKYKHILALDPYFGDSNEIRQRLEVGSESGLFLLKHGIGLLLY